MIFPVSGVETSVWVPPVTAFVISFFTSMGGVSGAFLLLPFQVSVLGFVTPAVTPTNLVFNIVGIPSGVYRYFKEGRMVWPLAWNIIVGTLPGLFIGGIIRIRYLPDPAAFKLFVGVVLLYVGARMFSQAIQLYRPQSDGAKTALDRMRETTKTDAETSGKGPPPIRAVSWSLSRTEYEFYGERFSFHTTGLFMLSLAVGMIGGIYGIGGGAIIAPFVVTFFGLPIHTIAGATLMGTCVTSVGGVIYYSVLASIAPQAGLAVAPDWRLGLLFGAGGLFGMYFGAAAQRYVPDRPIKIGLGVLITALGLKYVVGFFW